MNNEYLMVHKSILPAYYEVVIMVRHLINDEKMSVSDACKKCNISRSTFYKYKDYVYEPFQNFGKRAILAFNTNNDKGILSAILNCITNYQGNVIAINQDMPIQNNAYITISIDVSELKQPISELINDLKNIAMIKNVELLALE